MGSSTQPKGQEELLVELIGDLGAETDALRLLASFGSLARIMAAPLEAVTRITGGDAIARRIAAARQAVLAAQRQEIVRAAFDLRDPDLQRYIVGLFQGYSVERLHIIYLDPQRRYLIDEALAEGRGSQVSASLRPLVARAFDLGAAGIVLAHNHTSGEPSPSEADIAVTRRLAQSLGDLDLVLADHLIVAGRTILSMRGAGLL